MFLSTISYTDMIHFVTSKDNYQPKLSILDHFIDFFTELLGGKGKRRYLCDIHKRLYDHNNAPQDRISALIDLIKNMEPSYCNEFNAEVILDREFFFTDKTKVCFYFQQRIIQEIEEISLSDLDSSYFLDNFNSNNIIAILPDDPIANFSAFSTAFFNDLYNITQPCSLNNIKAANLKVSFTSWYEDQISKFICRFNILCKSGRLPDKFKPEVYHQYFNKLKSEKTLAADDVVNNLRSLTDEIKNKVIKLIRSIYSCITDELNDSIKAFHALEKDNTEKQHVLIQDILEHRMKLIPFHESFIFSTNKIDENIRIAKENHAINAAFDLYGQYFNKSKLIKNYDVKSISANTQHAVNNILSLLDHYQKITTEPPCVISIEPVSDYEHQYGLYSAHRVCLLQNGHILKAVNIPNNFTFLVINHIIGKPFIEKNNRIYNKNYYYLEKGVSKKSFLANVSRYFYFSDVENQKL